MTSLKPPPPRTPPAPPSLSCYTVFAVLLGLIASASTAAAQELRDQYHKAPRDTVTQEVYDGWKQFNLNCARCHGEDVQGTTIAPHLILSLKPDGPINTKELFIQTVCAGRPAKGMPSWCALGMEMPTIEKMYAYVKGRSEAKIGPGRPAVKTGT
jgi:mono/diheme cytochrome c family protein